MIDNEKKAFPKKGKPIERKTFRDDSGINRVVLVPEGETDLRKGIPISLDLTPVFGHMPEAFQRELYAALHAQGLIEPTDYFKKGAAERYRRALQTVIKHDFTNILALANKEIHRD